MHWWPMHSQRITQIMRTFDVFCGVDLNNLEQIVKLSMIWNGHLEYIFY